MSFFGQLQLLHLQPSLFLLPDVLADPPAVEREKVEPRLGADEHRSPGVPLSVEVGEDVVEGHGHVGGGVAVVVAVVAVARPDQAEADDPGHCRGVRRGRRGRAG